MIYRIPILIIFDKGITSILQCKGQFQNKLLTKQYLLIRPLNSTQIKNNKNHVF